MAKSKSWYTSRTILLAVAQGFAGIIAAFVFEFPEVAGLAIVKSVIDVLLRFLTEKPIKS